MLNSKSNIVLIGLPGTSKTSAGKLLAKKKNMMFRDSDLRFEELYGSISEYFDRFGEALFRIKEGKILYDYSTGRDCVISCGGGAVLNPACMSSLKSTGVVVWLTASNETISERLEKDKSRPLLRGDLVNSLKALEAERLPLYKKYADITLSTDGLTPEQIADKIIKAI